MALFFNNNYTELIKLGKRGYKTFHLLMLLQPRHNHYPFVIHGDFYLITNYYDVLTSDERALGVYRSIEYKSNIYIDHQIPVNL